MGVSNIWPVSAVASLEMMVSLLTREYFQFGDKTWRI